MTQVLRLVLQIIEGTNFHLLEPNSSLVLQGKLDGVGLKTEPVALSSANGLRLEIGEELIWKISQRNFQRIKASKALKLECFNVGPGSSIKSVGYIIINLKSVSEHAQCGWRRLLGSSSPAQSCPQLLLSVSLLDSNRSKKEEQKQALSLDKRVEDISGRPTELNLKNGISYIGSERFCKERFQFSCTLISLAIPPQILQPESARLQLKLFGQTLTTNQFDIVEPKTVLNKTFVFDIFSKTPILVQFLSENPIMEVALTQENRTVLETSHFLAIELGQPMTTDLFFKGCNRDPQPKVTVAFSIQPLREVEEVNTKEVQREAEIHSPFAPSAPILLEDDTEIEIISEYSKNFETESDMADDPAPLPLKMNPKPTANKEVVHRYLHPESHRTQHYDGDGVAAISDRERMVKVVEELEEWKLRHKILFTEEMEAKREEMMRAWEHQMTKRQEELEFEKVKSIEKSKEYAASLEEEIAKLKLKGKDVEREDEKFKSYRRKMEEKLEEKDRTLKKQQLESESKMSILVYQNKKLQERAELLEAECAKLKKIQKSSESAEIIELKEKMRDMEQNLKKAQEEKARITKEWAKSQRQAVGAKDHSTHCFKNINSESFFPDQERVRLMQEKISLEKLQQELLQMKQRPTQTEVINTRKLLEQRDALLKTGMYNEQSEVVQSLDEAIKSARNKED
ncbi:ninein-like protein isoform X1 [Cloeon dipterum]|uniref:ninein-like protein isoform X1 n=1 Tax=Cloeon dipterum TaxID=197152 RepID=UPI0032201BDD